LVAAYLLRDERRAPAVVGQILHRGLVPVPAAAPAPAEHGGDHVVAVGEHIRFDADGVPRYAFDGEPPAVDLGCHTLDHHAAPPVDRLHAPRLMTFVTCPGLA